MWCEAARGEMVRVGDLASLIQQVQAAPTASQPHEFTRYTTIRGHLMVLGSSSATQVGLPNNMPRATAMVLYCLDSLLMFSKRTDPETFKSVSKIRNFCT